MSASIWYQPFGTPEVLEIDLGCSLGSVDEYDQVTQAVGESLSGRRTRIVYSGTRAVTYTAVIGSSAVAQQLEALQSHLRRGGHCTVAEDNNKTFFGICLGTPSTTLEVHANLWGGYSAYTLTADDVLVLSGPGPAIVSEEVVIASSAVPTVATLDDAPVNDWDRQEWVAARLKGFWPVLRLRSGATRILRTDRRITWELELPMEVPPSAYDALALDPGDALTPDDAVISIDTTVTELHKSSTSGGPSWWSPDNVSPVSGPTKGRRGAFPW